MNYAQTLTAFGIFALAATLSWFLWYANYQFGSGSGSNGDFYFAGTDENGNQLRLKVQYMGKGNSAANVIDYEIKQVHFDQEVNAQPGDYVVFQSPWNGESDSMVYFLSINSHNLNADGWHCTKIGNGNSQSDFQSWGYWDANDASAAGDLEYYLPLTITSSNGHTAQIYAKASRASTSSPWEITDIGGYNQNTVFSSNVGLYQSFLPSSVPAFTNWAACEYPIDEELEGKDFEVEDLRAMIELEKELGVQLTDLTEEEFHAQEAEKAKKLTEQDVVVSNSGSCDDRHWIYIGSRAYAGNAGSSITTACGYWCSSTYTTANGGALGSGTNTGVRCSKSGERIFAFTGSQNSNDWWNNIAGAFSTRSPNSVHSGFKTEADSYTTWVNQYKSGWSKLTFVGHSLGGAVAAVQAVYNKNYGPTIGIVTYGQPQTFKDASGAFSGINGGYKRFVTQDRKDCWHSPDSQDPVTGVAGILGYKHGGSAKYKVKKWRASWSWGICSNKYSGWQTYNCGPTAITGWVNVNLHYGQRYQDYIGSAGSDTYNPRITSG
jgi:hypothetical protein